MGERSEGDTAGESLEELPALVARLGADLVQLVDSRLALLAVEIKDDATAYVRGSVAFVIGGVVAAIGFVLCNVAIALFIAQALASTTLEAPVRHALGFTILGVAYMVGGVLLARRAQSRLAGLQPSLTAGNGGASP